MERFVASVDKTMASAIEAIINTCRMNIESACVKLIYLFAIYFFFENIHFSLKYVIY
jgi:uncharacterized membrane protein (GlpM family)